jgi:hypothetical protein
MTEFGVVAQFTNRRILFRLMPFRVGAPLE